MSTKTKQTHVRLVLQQVQTGQQCLHLAGLPFCPVCYGTGRHDLTKKQLSSIVAHTLFNLAWNGQRLSDRQVTIVKVHHQLSQVNPDLYVPFPTAADMQELMPIPSAFSLMHDRYDPNAPYELHPKAHPSSA